MTKFITAFSLFLAVVAGSTLGYFFLLERQAEVRNKAIAECAEAYRYTFSEGTTATVSVPVSEKFDECLQLKNIEK